MLNKNDLSLRQQIGRGNRSLVFTSSAFFNESKSAFADKKSRTCRNFCTRNNGIQSDLSRFQNGKAWLKAKFGKATIGSNSLFKKLLVPSQKKHKIKKEDETDTGTKAPCEEAVEANAGGLAFLPSRASDYTFTPAQKLELDLGNDLGPERATSFPALGQAWRAPKRNQPYLLNKALLGSASESTDEPHAGKLARVVLVGDPAETNRAPFDLPEAEAESVAGYNVEYVRDAILNSSLLAGKELRLRSPLNKRGFPDRKICSHECCPRGRVQEGLCRFLSTWCIS
ncbi:hypothetical protein HAX54_002717 [Datura stramonium]|uniref:Uncharacterized protein n=1 Tax=Datura stramonium TaxID=4076 RepID=A0ABS8RT56_DATST|nr:hypothetical protein [Datura stramonium]